MVGTVEKSEVERMIGDDSDETLLIDVRSGEEVAEGMIPSAIHVPLEHVPVLFADPDPYAWAEVGVEDGPPAKDARIVFYCRSGARSGLAAAVVEADSGFTNTHNYTGSWLDWTGQDH